MSEIQFKTTPEYDALPRVEKDATFYSDLYKDRNGFRPQLAAFRAMSDDERAREIQRVGAMESTW